jgi:hypothetical protein
VLNDIRFALRTLISQRSFTAVIVITLALGIGANIAIFSVVNAVLLQELPFPDPDQIYKLETFFEGGRATDGALAPIELERLNQDDRFVDVAAGTFRYEGTVLDPEGNPLKVLAYGVSEGFFDIFGVPMALGRSFNEEDYGLAQTGVPNLIISYPVWRDFFGQNPGIVGVAAAVAMRQVIASQLYEMSALDPRVLILVPLVLLVVSLLATLLPAIRATRIDPSLTLRSD